MSQYNNAATQVVSEGVVVETSPGAPVSSGNPLPVSVVGGGGSGSALGIANSVWVDPTGPTYYVRRETDSGGTITIAWELLDGTPENPTIANLKPFSPALQQVSQQIGGTAVSTSNPVPIIDGYLAPTAISWTSATAVNSAATVSTAGYDTVVITALPSGTISAGHITFEVFDGVNWLPIKAARAESYNTEGGYALTGPSRVWQVSVGGFPQFRTRLDTAITGSGSLSLTTITSSAPDVSAVTVGLDPSQPLPAGTNLLGQVTQGGSAGTDASANPPALPTLGNGFGSSGPYANYTLIKTIAANPARANIDIENTSGAQIVVVRDDGTATAGNALTNASVFALAGGAGTASQGGSWSSTTFKGRIQIFAASSTAQVAAFQD